MSYQGPACVLELKRDSPYQYISAGETSGTARRIQEAYATFTSLARYLDTSYGRLIRACWPYRLLPHAASPCRTSPAANMHLRRQRSRPSRNFCTCQPTSSFWKLLEACIFHQAFLRHDRHVVGLTTTRVASDHKPSYASL